jgi:DNA-binding transcriptional LysR family regulator
LASKAPPEAARREPSGSKPEGPRGPEPRFRPSQNHYYFEAVVRHGSIRKAADALHLASSALNRRILDLEAETGTALFERLPRGVRLTAAGELLLHYVRWSLKELRKLEDQINQLRGQQRGLVRIGVPESVTSRLLPAAIVAYQAIHEGVDFHVVVEGPEPLLDALMTDHVDLILTHTVPAGASATILATAEHPLCAVVAPDHPLTKLPRVSLADCASYPLAMPDHTLAARGFLDLALEEARLSVRPALESDSIETLKSFASMGQAVSFSFRVGAHEEPYGLVALMLSDARCAEAQLHVAARRGRVLPVAAASFAEQLVIEVLGVRTANIVSVP